MSLKQQLFEDLKESMKSKDTVRKEIIQMVRAGVLLIEKDTKTELDDQGVTAVVSKELKKLNDVLPDYI
ncbi:MAG: GatB/YqeY domain-containing protein, partial [Eubacterium sp.]|nr:GatB/YqeY domain-containing protein [Eubacterium sp.]